MKSTPCESTLVRIGHRSASALRRGLWLTLTIALATALLLFRLGTKSFWLDEATSAVLARVDGHVFLDAILYRQANMALYYFLLRGWIGLGESESFIRSLSVVAGVAAIPAIYLLGTRLFGSKAGRLAALLLSVHAFHIKYSQEARAYSLFMLLAILSSFFFIRALDRPSRKNWLAYILISTLMVYAQVFGAWVLLAQCVSLFFWQREIRWKPFLGSVVMIGFLISPLAYCLLLVSDRSQLYWLTKPTLQDLYKFGLNMTGDGGTWLLLAYLGMLLCAAAAGFGLLRSQAPAELWNYRFLLVWLILPIVSILGISFRWPVFESRFLILCVPPLVLLAADSFAQVRSKVLFSAALMTLLGLSLSGTYSYYRVRADKDQTDDWRDATRYVLSQAEPDDAVLFSYSEERLAFDEYQRRFQLASSPIHKFPEETILQLLTLRPSRPSPELLGNIVAGYRRVWVISAFQPNRASRQVEATLSAHYGEPEDRSFGFVHANMFADRSICQSDQPRDCLQEKKQ